MATFTDDLTAMNACADAITWARAYPTLDAAWAACERPDWMLWLIARTDGRTRDSSGRRRLVGLAARCAASVPQGGGGTAAIALAMRWADGDATVTVAMLRAYAAAAAAADAAAAAYAYAAPAADAADAKTALNRQNAAMIREVYPLPPMISLAAGGGLV